MQPGTMRQCGVGGEETRWKSDFDDEGRYDEMRK
jgi:hypothetical protein